MLEDDKTPIFGRTDFRNGVSEAKFDADVDFYDQKCLAPPKSVENREKPKKIKWQGVTVSAEGHGPKNRKWPENGPQELRIEPRASPGLKMLFADDAWARGGRQWRDSAKSG